MEFKLKALTDIWTGGADPGDENKLHLTGIKGSIRWWYEALIRGLGYYACDPSDKSGDHRCTLDIQKFKKQINKGKTSDQALERIGVCWACRLFGCTNWSGKFILRVKDDKDKLITNKIKKDDKVVIEFIEIKKISEEEKQLINFTVKLIVEYGAIGGKTTLKPSEEINKNTEKSHHFDYGIIDWQEGAKIQAADLSNFPKNPVKYKDKNKKWPNLKYFWFVKDACINRVTHNYIVKRDMDNPKIYLNRPTDDDQWIGGSLGKQSKKIFSFHSVKRCWGYTQDQVMYDSLTGDLKKCGLKNIIQGSLLQKL